MTDRTVSSPRAAEAGTKDSWVGPPILAIVGPTASGKSSLSLELAERVSAEIVNADAFQLYRGMDIGTAKVPRQERRGIVHHQLDVLTISEEASVAAYQRHARADIADVLARGKVPLLVGGSGLYVRAVLDRLVIPPTDRSVRARLNAELVEHGVAVMAQRLRALDPVAAQAIDPHNGRRIVRALEVIELTGQPFSATMPRRDLVHPTLTIALEVPRADLDARIQARTVQMWRSGFIEEVRELAAAGLAQTPTAVRAVGYPQALAQLDGRLNQDEAIEATTAATRRLVRRQESWFGADPRVQWLNPHCPSLLTDVINRYTDLWTGLTGPDDPAGRPRDPACLDARIPCATETRVREGAGQCRPTA